MPTLEQKTWLIFCEYGVFSRTMLLMTIDVRNDYVYLIFIWTLSIYTQTDRFTATFFQVYMNE